MVDFVAFARVAFHCKPPRRALGAACGIIADVPTSFEQARNMSDRSFPKVKIKYQTHAILTKSEPMNNR
jgi:hypothetical protein